MIYVKQYEQFISNFVIENIVHTNISYRISAMCKRILSVAIHNRSERKEMAALAVFEYKAKHKRVCVQLQRAMSTEVT